MAVFLYWDEVQEQLTKHARETGQPYSFYDAMRELWEKGFYHTADALPVPESDAWDTLDADGFMSLINRSVVTLEHFIPGFQRNETGGKNSFYKKDRDIRPIRVACDQAVGLHGHGAMEILVCLKGTAELQLEGEKKKIPENSFVMIAPSVLHDAQAGPDTLLITFALSQTVIEDTLYRLLENESVLSRFFRDSTGMRSSGYLQIEDVYPEKVMPFLRGILREYYRAEEYSETVREAYLTLLLTHLLRYGGNFEHHRMAQERHSAPILAVLKYIQVNYRTVTLKEIADQFHYEAGYLGKVIKQATGENYTTIVQRLRIEEAKRLILESDLSLEEIGEMAGFESQVHFSRSFKAAVGMSPSAYRKEHKK